MLIIPFNYAVIGLSDTTVISVELTKQSPPDTSEKPIEKEKPIKKSEPIKQAVVPPVKLDKKTTQKFNQNEPLAKKQPPPRKIESQKSTLKTKSLPSYGEILNSMEGTNKLFNLNKDFQIADENADDFIMKQMIPEKKSQLIVDKKTIGFYVGDGQPLSLKILKGLAKRFSLIPIDDQERNRDTLNYCLSLGRKSVFCPNDNPLVY